MREFRQEYEASFETYSGRCLHGFSRAESVRERVYDPTVPVHVGMDFNLNPMTATIWQEYLDEQGETIVHQIDEIILPTSNTDEMARELRNRYARPKASFSGNGESDVSHVIIYPDPAGAAKRTSAQGRTDISILFTNGFTVRALNSAPLVRDRLNVTNAMFQNAAGNRHAFVSPRCRKSIECYERYSYREGSSEPDKTSGHDHVVDATGYYIHTRFGRAKIKERRLSALER